MESSATAFLCGFLIMKIEVAVNMCNLCLSVLRNTSPNKGSALLEIIYNQDRGKLNYPNEPFIRLIEFLIKIIIEIIPNLCSNNVDIILKRIISSYFYDNVLFQCKVHCKVVCNVIIENLIPPILANFCHLQNQNIKKTSMNTKKGNF